MGCHGGSDRRAAGERPADGAVPDPGHLGNLAKTVALKVHFSN